MKNWYFAKLDVSLTSIQVREGPKIRSEKNSKNALNSIYSKRGFVWYTSARSKMSVRIKMRSFK